MFHSNNDGKKDTFHPVAFRIITILDHQVLSLHVFPTGSLQVVRLPHTTKRHAGH